MSDDMLLHFSSNSSNQSDHSLPTKIAKLEARMVGKASSAASAAAAIAVQPAAQQQQPAWSSVVSSAVKFVSDELAEPSTSSDSDDDNGGEFLIQANTQKRQKLQQDEGSTVFEHVDAVTEGRQVILETVETKASDTNRKKHGRGRGHTVSSRGRGSRVNDQTRSQICPATVTPSNGQPEYSYNKDNRSKEHFRNDSRLSLEEEVASLRAKVAALEEDLRKSFEEASNYQNLCKQLEKELKDLKDKEQQVNPKSAQQQKQYGFFLGAKKLSQKTFNS